MKKNIFAVFLCVMMSLVIFGCEKKTETPKTTKTDETTTVTTKAELSVSYYDGGEMIKTEKYTKDNFTLFTPEKDGFTFLGWFKDQALTQAFDQSQIDSVFENGTLSLYAAWETKDLFNVSIKGSVGNKTVINPAFTWKNNFEDSSFKVKVLKGTSIQESDTVNADYYLCSKLDFNTDYSFIIEGVTSHKLQTVDFKTIENNNYSINTAIDVNDPYMSNMVIQRDEPIVINGRGPQRLLIPISFGSEMYYSLSDEEGEFSVTIPAHSASFNPIKIVIGVGFKKRATLENVLIGDVYLFTGQSNMQWTVAKSDVDSSDYEKAINSSVRYFTQGVNKSTELALHTSNGRWFSINSENDCQGYSALAFMGGALLGDFLKTNNNVPLGILTAYQGDTNIANWMGKGYYTGTSSTKYLHYNAMIYPLRDASIKGVVWYQGCNNSAAGGDYKDFLLAYFKNYRDLFHNEELKFYVIGLACYDGDSGNNYDFSFVRESQAAACAQDDKAYFISTCDDGDPTYIHPEHKRYIALRIMKSIASSMYGADYYSEGPSYKSHTVSGDTVTIEVNNGEGLKTSGTIDDFYLAGADGKYYSAIAKIEDEKIIVSSDKVSNPVYIKYGFGKSPFTNIFNKDDYSMVPFRTDNHNINIELLDYNSTDEYSSHPSGDVTYATIVNEGLKITKNAGTNGYGSIRLSKWGMIAYDAVGFRFSFIGTNSGAKVQFRAVEGPTSEIWAYEVIDNFEGLRTFEGTISDFKVVYNKKDSIFNTQCISYIEVMITSGGACDIIVTEARFVDVERSKPRSFMVGSPSVDKNGVAEIVVGKSLFATSYTLLVSDTKGNYDNPLYSGTSTGVMFHFDASNLRTGVPYYLRSIATNELGETTCTNDNAVFYLNDENTYIITNFDYETDAELFAFVQGHMRVHSSIDYEMTKSGAKVILNGDSWAYFIFDIETGANTGKSKLVFDADLSEYKGNRIVIQLCDTANGTYNYSIDLTAQKTGTFEIPLSEFKNYNNQALNAIFFNFDDPAGGDYIILDNIKLVK